jgi:hypothetical protein
MAYTIKNIPDDLLLRVKVAAKHLGKTPTEFIKEAVREKVKRDRGRLIRWLTNLGHKSPPKQS